MHKSSLFFNVHQEGSAPPGEEDDKEILITLTECRALVRRPCLVRFAH